MASNSESLESYRAIVQQLISDIEARVVDQVNRRVLAEPGADSAQIIASELALARESLQLLAEEFEDEGEGVGAELVRALIDDWLPMLAKEIKPPH